MILYYIVKLYVKDSDLQPNDIILYCKIILYYNYIYIILVNICLITMLINDCDM